MRKYRLVAKKGEGTFSEVSFLKKVVIFFHPFSVFLFFRFFRPPKEIQKAIFLIYTDI